MAGHSELSEVWNAPRILQSAQLQKSARWNHDRRPFIVFFSMTAVVGLVVLSQEFPGNVAMAAMIWKQLKIYEDYEKSYEMNCTPINWYQFFSSWFATCRGGPPRPRHWSHCCPRLEKFWEFSPCDHTIVGRLPEHGKKFGCVSLFLDVFSIACIVCRLFDIVCRLPVFTL